MDYRVIFGVFLVVLAVQAAPTDDFSTKDRHDISNGLLILNEEDRKALEIAAQQSQGVLRSLTRDEISHGPLALNADDKKALSEVNKQSQEKDTQHEISRGPLVLSEEDKKVLLEINNQVNELNKENPGENAHGFLSSVLDSIKTISDVVKRIIGKVKEHEEKSHNAIEKLRSSDPDTTDVCVRDIFGIPYIMNPVYCGVKYFSQVAMGLHELTQSVTPVKQSLIKLRNDLAGCDGKAFGEKFVCTTQASRDAWDNSDYVRARLGQHLTLIRYLALDIASCIHSNHAVQSNLVNKVALCASASNK